MRGPSRWQRNVGTGGRGDEEQSAPEQGLPIHGYQRARRSYGGLRAGDGDRRIWTDVEAGPRALEPSSASSGTADSWKRSEGDLGQRGAGSPGTLRSAGSRARSQPGTFDRAWAPDRARESGGVRPGRRTPRGLHAEGGTEAPEGRSDAVDLWRIVRTSCAAGGGSSADRLPIRTSRRESSPTRDTTSGAGSQTPLRVSNSSIRGRADRSVGWRAARGSSGADEASPRFRTAAVSGTRLIHDGGTPRSPTGSPEARRSTTAHSPRQG